jgi:integrase
MQAVRTHAWVSVTLSTVCKGKPRKRPVWEMRYRLPSGKESTKVLGPAWTKKGRPPRGYLTEGEARKTADGFAELHSSDTPSVRRTFGVAVGDFVRFCEQEKGLRGSTLHGYKAIADRLAARPWRPGSTWADRVLDTFSGQELVAVRNELISARRSPDTVNHYRRVVRGVFGAHASSPALAWAWMGQRPESEGKLRFYTPAQVELLITEAFYEIDVAVYTLATEEGPRLSEIRAFKVENVDFEADVVRFEDGHAKHGGPAGNKGRRVRPVPMSANVRRVLWPLCQGKSPDALVFEDPIKPGEPIDGTNLYRRFINAAKRAELPRIRFHDLRHTFGTQAIRVFPIHEVQAMMGHRNISTTQKYLHYAPDPDGAAKLTALWGERGGDSRHTPPDVMPLPRAA